MDNFGNKIRKMRKARGFTQEQLAELIGIDNKHLSRIEIGKHMPTYSVLKRLAKALEFDIYGIDELNVEEKTPDKFLLKSLKILNSAKTVEEKKYYLEALQHAQKGLKINISANHGKTV